MGLGLSWLPLEQGVEGVFLCGLFSSFPSALLPRTPQCRWTWPSTFWTTAILAWLQLLLAPLIQAHRPKFLSLGSPQPRSSPWVPWTIIGAGVALGQCLAHCASPGLHPFEAPHCPSPLHSASQKAPLPPSAGEADNWGDEGQSTQRPCSCQQCGLKMVHACRCASRVIVCALACAFCWSQPLRICLFPFYDHCFSLCTALGRAWRSRNCLQVVLQAWSRPLLSPCRAHNGSSQGQFA